MKKKPTPIKARLTTTRLIEIVAADLDTSPDAVRETVMTTFDVIARAASSGHDVAVTNFGTWVSYTKKRRKARNPQNDEPVIVPMHRAVRFRVGPSLADAVRRKDRQANIRKAPKGTGVAK